MMDFKLTQQVQRKPKKGSKLLSRLMVIFAIIFVILGIIFNNGYFMPAFLLALLYYIYTMLNDSAYEYNFENEKFSIDVIKGKRRRRTAHVLYYKNLEVVTPPDHELVAKYKKNGEKIKLLLDLNEEMLRFLKVRYPMKVFLQ